MLPHVGFGQPGSHPQQQGPALPCCERQRDPRISAQTIGGQNDRNSRRPGLPCGNDDDRMSAMQAYAVRSAIGQSADQRGHEPSRLVSAPREPLEWQFNLEPEAQPSASKRLDLPAAFGGSRPLRDTAGG
jgi:hypothetical protein